MTTIELKLPDELARKVKAEGLLKPQAVAQLFRRELKRRKTKSLFSIMDELHAAKIPRMTMDEVQAEVNAVRAERRGKRAAGS